MTVQIKKFQSASFVGRAERPRPITPELLLVDEIATVATEEVKGMARKLDRKEALLAGTSTGANLVAALRPPICDS